MASNPYDSCPCGSGKKFKWCCQDIYTEIDEAFRQAAAGQHEAALRTLETVAQNHAGNPEVHGRHAQLLAAHGDIDNAEKALELAFALNPNYPFGHVLRGQMRVAEGEIAGAAILFHKAADLYAPDAHEHLAVVHEMIAEVELKLNRPIAALAALKRAIRFSPNNAELRTAMDTVFGPKSRLPAAARNDYAFRRPTAASGNWDRALAVASTGRLTDVQRVFQLWTQKHPDDPAAWYNLGLIHAWMGDNAEAVESLSQFVERETDENATADAWTLAEVLRCGHGMESEADYVEHRIVTLLRDPRPLIALLQDWEKAHRLIGLTQDPEAGIMSAIVLDEVSSLVLSGSAAPPARLAAYMLVSGRVLDFSHPDEASVNSVMESARSRLSDAIEEPRKIVGPVRFGDVVIDALLFPTAETTQLDAEAKIRSHAQSYFEEAWPSRPLRSLRGSPPIDAAGHPMLRKRLRGVIQFLEQCAVQTSVQLYDFNRLRHKLGLDGAAPAVVIVQSTDARDLSAMNAGELAKLEPTELSDAELDQAFRAALAVDAGEIAARFAQAAIDRPVDGSDRFSHFNHLIGAAVAAGEFDRAQQLVDAGDDADRTGNAGRRRLDFGQRRGQILAKKGDETAAAATFDQLIEEFPTEMKIAAAAAEALLGSKQPQAAARFAERGLAQAREHNDRDMEGYFTELAEAAKRSDG